MTQVKSAHVKAARARMLAVVALVLVVLFSASLTSCAQRKVEVKTGERVVCTYGEQVESTVRTIKVRAKDAGKYSVKTVTVLCDKHRALEESYAAAQAAITQGDLAKAKTELEKVVKVDPNYKLAKKQLGEISAGKTPTPDSSGSSAGTGPTIPSVVPTETTPGDDTPPEGPVASLLVYTPDTLSGLRAEKVIADTFSVSRNYLPATPSDIAAIVVVAEQHRSVQAAQDWLRDNIRAGYTQSARNVRVGSHDGYMGTDGSRFAAIAWTEGPVTVAIEADAKGDPSAVLGQLQNLASQIAR